MINKKIAYITDIHLDEQQPKDFGANARKNWNRILTDVAAREVDEVIFGGDIGEPSANQYFFDSLANYNLKITLGNHDTFSEAVKYYSSEFIISCREMYYSYSDLQYKYIFLDSSSAEISLSQVTWLAGELKSDKRLLLFIHHPILKVDTIVDVKYPLKNRDAIRDQLTASGRPVTIFCGHYHTEDEIEMDNLKQYVTPAASYQIKKGTAAVIPHVDYFGYRMIYVTTEEITTELVLFSQKNHA